MPRLAFLLFICLASASQAAVCDGRYAAVTLLIEQSYKDFGTLYSGGPNYGTVGPTLEVYRMLRRLPDAGMAQRRDRTAAFVDPAGNLSDPAFAEDTLHRSLPRIHDPDFRRDRPEGSTDSEVLLNVYTVVGPYPGWWLTPEAPHLTEVQRVIASHGTDDALDWLLTVQAASHRPFRISWTLHAYRDGRSEGSRALLAHALRRLDETDDLTWLIAAFLSQEDRAWRYPS
ncbi:MAG: hypothetical protein AAFX00_11185, partial [Pseudomonadota bacterium]